MTDERIFLGDKPLTVYTATQVRDVLEEAHRLEMDLRLPGAIMGISVRKLDSYSIGRTDG